MANYISVSIIHIYFSKINVKLVQQAILNYVIFEAMFRQWKTKPQYIPMEQ